MEQNNTPTPNNVAPEAMGKRSWLDRKFKLKEHGTSVKIEIMAGITTFMAMVYILMVNAGMFSDLQGTVFNGPSYGAMYITTAISAIIGTVLIGLLSGLPLAQAPGMGLNAFFVYTICMGFGLTYANALVLVLIDGIVFIILTVTGLRKAIFTAIPDCVKKAIPAGIGLFIAFIGLQNAGIVVARQRDVGKRYAHTRHPRGLYRHCRFVKKERQGRNPLGNSRRGGALFPARSHCSQFL